MRTGVLNATGSGAAYAPGPWLCDLCGEEIKKAKNIRIRRTHAVSEDPGIMGRGLTIMISHDYDSSLETTAPGQCARIEQYHTPHTPDFDLRTVSGPDALVRLLSLMAEGHFTWKLINPIIMRLFVPGYEQARHYQKDAIADGVIVEDAEDCLYESDIAGIVREYGLKVASRRRQGQSSEMP
jgi:hypothetical protein